MNEKELQIKRRFWYLKFERIRNDNDIIRKQIESLSEQADKIKVELSIIKKREEKNSVEVVQVIQELEKLRQQERKMTFDFDNIALQEQ